MADLGFLQRYLTIKAMTPAERKKVNPKVVFFAGKAAPGCRFMSRFLRIVLPNHVSHRLHC